MLRNIQLFKELNINAVRTSHYPQQPLWYKLCDEYGIYLVDETNLESHGLGYGPDNVSNFPEWQAAHLDRVKRLIERDKNHASVIFWSLGNEASNGKAFFTMYDWAKARDKSRPVQYEQAYQKDRNTDIICHMYPSWENMLRDAKKDLGRPYIMCEYAHAMGNSMGNFQDYWDLMRSSKNMQGGFIWEWYNHGYKTKDEQGRSIGLMAEICRGTINLMMATFVWMVLFLRISSIFHIPTSLKKYIRIYYLKQRISAVASLRLLTISNLLLLLRKIIRINGCCLKMVKQQLPGTLI